MAQTRTSTLVEQWAERRTKSAALYQRALKVYPSGVTHDARYMEPFPIYITHADGSKKWDVDGKLSDWFRFYGDATHLGQDKLTNGQPGFKYSMNNNYKGESTNDREDKFTTRIAARVIDVKPKHRPGGRGGRSPLTRNFYWEYQGA